MHNTAYINAEKFYNKYCSQNIETKIVIDIGSLDVNGSLKPIFNKCHRYLGIDQCVGKNVNIVSTSHNIPLNNNFADIIVSSSCFEHDDMFWLTFLEMCRLLKNGGYLYINAPSNGPYHAHPTDNWRFYKDSWKALEQWGSYNKYNIALVESYLDPHTSNCSSKWIDSVGIYTKL
jgi:SAM-dependent methyltransferase